MIFISETVGLSKGRLLLVKQYLIPRTAWEKITSFTAECKCKFKSWLDEVMIKTDPAFVTKKSDQPNLCANPNYIWQRGDSRWRLICGFFQTHMSDVCSIESRADAVPQGTKNSLVLEAALRTFLEWLSIPFSGFKTCSLKVSSPYGAWRKLSDREQIPCSCRANADECIGSFCCCCYFEFCGWQGNKQELGQFSSAAAWESEEQLLRQPREHRNGSWGMG